MGAQIPVYDLDFIFAHCGHAVLPAGLQRERLFNVSYDIDSGDVKLYVLDQSERFVYKLGAQGLTRQYSGDDPRHGGDPGRLSAFLGYPVSSRDIVIDAVEGDSYYLYLDDARPGHSLRLIHALCAKFPALEQTRFLTGINAINQRRFNSLEEALTRKAISLLRLPLAGGAIKLYSRPYYHGHGYVLNQRTRRFLGKLFACDALDCSVHLQYAWIARDLTGSRTLLVTQHHGLLHELDSPG
jgi:hypothetical protein